MALGSWFNKLKSDKPPERQDRALPDNLVQLHRLKRQHQLLTVHIGGVDREFQSLLLDIDPLGTSIVLDQLFPRIASPQRLITRRLAVSCSQQNLPTRFDTLVLDVRETPTGHELLATMPETVDCSQRRAAYRVPVEKHVPFQVALQTAHDGKIPAKPINISIDGIRFEIQGHFKKLENGLAALFMQVGSEPLMACQLKICNLETAADEKGVPKTIMGARFIHLSPPQRKILERFVLQTQQEMRQRQLT